MSLSSLIVQREVATIRQVEEALARQVIYGGDLLTNLFEVARVDEEKVTRLLAESNGLPPATTGELPTPTDEARATVPPEMAAHRAMLPLTTEGGRLVLAVAERVPSDVEDQLSFALGMPVEQRVAPMVRIRQALAATYGLPLERRMQRLIARLSGKPPAGGSIPPLVSHPPAMVEPPRPPSTPPFRPSPAFGTATTTMPKHRITSAGFPMPALPVVEGVEGVDPAANTVLLHDGEPLGLPPRVSTAPPPAISDAPAAGPTSRPPSIKPSLLQRDVVAGARASRRRRGPITLELAKQELEEAGDRDALLDVFFDFARQFFDYAAVFIVHGDIAEGRDAWGTGASRERVVGIGVPLDLPSLLATARDRRAAVTAPPASDGLDAVLLADLQRSTRASVLVAPVVVRTRAVALLLGDCGEHGVDSATASEVSAFAALVGHGFEKLIVRRKLHGFIAGSTSSNVGRVDPLLVGAKARRAKVTTPPAPPEIDPDFPKRVDTPFPASRPPRVSDEPLTPAPTSVAPAPIPHDEPEGRDAPTSLDAPEPSRSVSNYPPPPANTFAVRRPTGPPIPREEPDSHRRPHADAVAHAEQADQADSGAGSSDDASAMDDEHARALLDELSMDSATNPDDTDYSSASMAVAVPARLPPTSRAEPVAQLPSVIVDMDQEFAVLVDRLIENGVDDAAEAELLRQGHHAMPSIMARFPGPIMVDRGRYGDAGPRVSDCGPILRLVAGQRKVALPFVVVELASPDPEKRYWATFLVTELPYAEATAGLVARLFDDEARTRRAARLAMMAIAKSAPQVVVDEISKIAVAPEDSRREAAIAVLGELREPLAVPVLVLVLGERDEKYAEPTRRALVLITRQDFGTDARQWSSWWTANSPRHRIEWLIDALSHDVSDLRRGAGEELKALTKEYFGFSDDLPPRERERAQQRYRDWWVTEGRGRFRKR
jgi:hypothetical protein